MSISKTLFILILITAFTATAFGQAVKREATIMSLTGEARIKTAVDRRWVPAEEGMTLTEGDTIEVGKDAWILLKLKGVAGDAEVELEGGSLMLFREFTEDEDGRAQNTLLDLALGEIMIRTEKLSPESKFQVKTPASVAGVRGTKFKVKVEAVE
jgi:hypothetical protein